MPRPPIPTWFFAVVVVRRDDWFLLIHEASHGEHWYLPAGRVEPGESLIAGAERETLEEGGIPVRIDGVIRIEHTAYEQASRVRVIFTAVPVDETLPKTTPDQESLGAAWVRLDELPYYSLRGDDVTQILKYVAAGGPIHPVSVIQAEGSPFSFST